MANEITGFMPGDILFYEKLPGDLYDEAIVAVTQYRFVHVAIALSAIQKIEALSGGVMLTPIDNGAVAASWSYTKEVHPSDTTQLSEALKWLESEKGTPYGWADAANALIARAGFNLAVNVGDHLDCSALATAFLIKAGGVHNLIQVTDVHKVTPAMLAIYLGVK